jgi:prepilin signal peptidase PulO-like enzyme (type II secretory pathway)
VHPLTALCLLPCGFAVGWPASTLSARYGGPPSRHRRRAIAAVTAVTFGAIGWRFGFSAELAAYLYLASVGTLLAFIDSAVKRLPDPFTLPSYLVGVALLGLTVPLVDDGGARFGYAIVGMAALWFLYGVQHFFAPSQIGRGDVKLAGVLGLFLGWLGEASWMLGVLLGFAFGGTVAVALLISRKASRKTEIPFGPYMIAGAIVAIVIHGAP